MGLLNTINEIKNNPFAIAKKRCKEHNLKLEYFQEWMKEKGYNPLSETTIELVDEFFNRPNLLYQIDIPTWVYLPESIDVVHGVGFGGTSVADTNRKQVKVQSKLRVVKNGLVFKKALHKSEDLRIAWDTITDVDYKKRSVFVICDSVQYEVSFMDKDTANLFYLIVKDNKTGQAEEGWD